MKLRKNWWEWLWPNRVATFVPLTLAACSADVFISAQFEGGISVGDSSPESSTDADSGSNVPDSSGLDAREAGQDSSTDAVDANPDAPCPTGIAACDDAIVAYCERLKTCCAGQCTYAWQNTGGSQCIAQFSTGGCSNKIICEKQCLTDMQSASCATIKMGPAPAYVANSCWSLWQ